MRTAPPFRIERLDHLVLRVRDLERLVAFYGEVLGCEVARRRDELGLVHLRAGASLIDLVSIEGPLGRKGGAAAGAEGRNLDHLCLRIDPFDESALLAHLAAHAIGPEGAVQNRFGADGEGPSLYFVDPEGNTIELKGPPVELKGPPVPLAPAALTSSSSTAPDAQDFLALVSRRSDAVSVGAAPEVSESLTLSNGSQPIPVAHGSVLEAARCLQRFTAAFNAADPDAVDRELHFPHLMLAGTGTLSWDAPGKHPPGFFEALRASGWHHTRYEAITPVLVAADKVHFVVRYVRCAADDAVLSTHENLWIVNRAGQKWGIALRSY